MASSPASTRRPRCRFFRVSDAYRHALADRARRSAPACGAGDPARATRPRSCTRRGTRRGRARRARRARGRRPRDGRCRRGTGSSREARPRAPRPRARATRPPVRSRPAACALVRRSCIKSAPSTKMGATRPFREAGEMWCGQDSSACRRFRLRLEQDRHWPVVDQRDVHSRSEDAARDLHALRFESLAEALVERLGDLWARSAREARPVPLARIRKQRELADDQSCPARRRRASGRSGRPRSRRCAGARPCPRAAQRRPPRRHPRHRGAPGVPRRSARHDVVVDRHGRLTDALDDRLQSRSSAGGRGRSARPSLMCGIASSRRPWFTNARPSA